MLQKLFVNPYSTSLYSICPFFTRLRTSSLTCFLKLLFINVISDRHIAKYSDPYMTSYLAFCGSVTTPSLKHSVLALASPVIASWFSSPLQGCNLQNLLCWLFLFGLINQGWVLDSRLCAPLSLNTIHLPMTTLLDCFSWLPPHQGHNSVLNVSEPFP